MRSLSLSLLITLASTALTGCFDSDSKYLNTSPAPPTRVEAEPEPPAPPAATQALTCLADHPADVRAIQRVRQVAEASVHELVTCGGAQLQISTSFVARVLLSNPQFFDPETLATLDDFLGFSDLPFEHQPDGQWRMALNADSTFDLRFMLPGSDVVETANVFDLAAYLEGAEVDSALTFDEMLEDFEAENIWRITWTGYGPLADVMFPEGRPDAQQFVVRASLYDLALLVLGETDDLPDFGPFENLPDLELDSLVHLVDARDGVTVAYDFGGTRQSLGHFHTEGQVAFELRSLVAEGEGVVLQGEAADLRVLERGTVAGPLVYAVDGVAVDGVRVVDDFGDGSGYPEASYWCPEDWSDAPWSAPTVTDE